VTINGAHVLLDACCIDNGPNEGTASLPGLALT